MRRAILAGAVLAMAAGIWGGLIRLGLPLGLGPDLAVSHGPVMVCGLFGTLISLERAVALGRRWAFLAPMLFVAGFAVLVAGAPSIVAVLLFVGGAAMFAAASTAVLVLQPALFTATLVVGAAALLAGNLLWLGGSEIPEVTGWWIAFFVATISAERLELTRAFRPGPLAQTAFVAALVVLSAGAAMGLTTGTGRWLTGAGLLAISLWLLRNDVARRTVLATGAPRYFAAAMLAGYFWLATAGMLLLAGTGLSLQYDLALHAVFLGFVLSMVLAHALIIFPAVTGIRLSYRPALYAPLALLHASVVLRVAGGMLGIDAVRVLSGPLTAASLLVFAGVLATTVRSRPLRAGHRQVPPTVPH
ncbi:MAG: hypothetical protein HY834_20830 [Devosia nanyangense]|uniref:NnrS family protein n=1 Tax=Devosia nanyangense TaxID=1228055 RepID=A0A933P0V7_9HYPH|nr:hypothetical protein [Devosia nanyangense]